MAFEVESVSALDVDVGEPGTRGVIETATGVLVRLTEEHRETYGIESEHDAPTYWRPEHTIEPFRRALRSNLQHKHGYRRTLDGLKRTAVRYRPDLSRRLQTTLGGSKQFLCTDGVNCHSDDPSTG